MAPDRPRPQEDADGPIAGIRVLELATLNAGPALGAMLGDLGAEVVKVELPGGDDFRVLGTPRGAQVRPGLWNLVARNKRMVTLDYKQPEGTEILQRMTAVADVIVLNQPESLLERLGCTYEAMAARNPRAVVVQVSGWGRTGPDATLPGNGTLGEAFAGLTHLQRDANGIPWLKDVLMGDHLTALAGVVGTLAACYWRDAHGGQGQLVDVALYEAVVAAVGPQIVGWDPNQASPAAQERQASHGIRQTFRTADDHWVAVTSYSGAQVARMLHAVGVDVPDGSASADLVAVVEDWIASNPLDTVLSGFRQARVGIAPVNDVGALLRDGHVRARGAVVEIDDPRLGPVRVPHPVPRFSRTPSAVRSVGGDLGADNEAVYFEWLGLGPEELNRLRTGHVI
jgi:crotonobetainyl-CoA:carnitine CoA-transferase CaiB-like acyl-CoA transferase